MAEKQLRVEFETVSPFKGAQFYAGDYFAAKPEEVPDEYWHAVKREAGEASIREQVNGLRKLIAEGEPIRNVKVFEQVTEPTWREIV